MILSPEERAVVEFLKSGRSIQSRLREMSDGDREDFQSFVPDLSGVRIEESQLIAVLHEMARKGVLERTESVRPYDSSEYLVEWKLQEPITGAPPS